MESGPVLIGAAIVGVQRGGTSSLAAALAAHPGICLAEGKEAHLFDRVEVQQSGPPPERLDELFAHRRPGQVLLDATPSYLYMPGCLEALKEHNPDLRAIVVLREPAERARSQHALELVRGWEELDFAAALRAERGRLAADPDPMALRSPTRIHSYRARGRYFEQLRRCLEIFPDTLVLRFDELVEEPGAVLGRCLGHLGLADGAGAGPIEKLNTARSSTRSWRESLLRLELTGERHRTERLLGWPRGSLARARSPRA